MISLYFIFCLNALSIIFTCPERGKVLSWPMKWFTSWRSRDYRWQSRGRIILVNSFFMTTSSSLTYYNLQWLCLKIFCQIMFPTSIKMQSELGPFYMYQYILLKKVNSWSHCWRWLHKFSLMIATFKSLWNNYISIKIILILSDWRCVKHYSVIWFDQ